MTLSSLRHSPVYPANLSGGEAVSNAGCCPHRPLDPPVEPAGDEKGKRTRRSSLRMTRGGMSVDDTFLFASFAGSTGESSRR